MKRKFIYICLFSWLILAGGCWNRIEVENLAIASALGIDKPAQGDSNQVLVSILVEKPGEAEEGGGGRGTSGASSQMSGWVNFGEGNSVEDAIRNLSTTTSKRLFLDHSRVIILGEEKARGGVGDIIDFLVRSRFIRLRNLLLVASESTALDTFSITPELTNIFSEEINDLITLSAPRGANTHAVNLKDFLIDLSIYGKEAVLPLLEIRKVPVEQSPENASAASENLQQKYKKNARLKGLAVFKGDKMVGKLDDMETKGFLWIIGESHSGTLTFDILHPETKKPVQATVEMTRATAEIDTEISDGKPVIRVKIDTEGNLGEFSEPNIPILPGVMELVDQGYARNIREQVKLALNKCQKEFQSDIFGFGARLRRQHLEYWKQNNLQENWTNIFPEIEVQVEVKANVRRSGVVLDSIELR